MPLVAEHPAVVWGRIGPRGIGTVAGPGHEQRRVERHTASGDHATTERLPDQRQIAEPERIDPNCAMRWLRCAGWMIHPAGKPQAVASAGQRSSQPHTSRVDRCHRHPSTASTTMDASSSTTGSGCPQWRGASLAWSRGCRPFVHVDHSVPTTAGRQGRLPALPQRRPSVDPGRQRLQPYQRQHPQRNQG